jgi:hypothetical protein
VWHLLHDDNVHICAQCPAWGMTCQLQAPTLTWACRTDPAALPTTLPDTWVEGVCRECVGNTTGSTGACWINTTVLSMHQCVQEDHHP